VGSGRIQILKAKKRKTKFKKARKLKDEEMTEEF
jgi:hypothetical protein